MPKGGSMLNLNAFFWLMAAVLIGAVILGLTLAGMFSPTEAAKAKGIIAQNELATERGQFELEQDKRIIEAKTQAEIKRISEETRYLQLLTDQKLDQSEREFQQTAKLKEFGMVGAFVALAILALGGAFWMGSRGWAAMVQAQALRHAAYQATTNSARADVTLKALGQISATLYTLQKDAAQVQNEIAQMQKQLDRVSAQLAETKIAVVKLEARGNGTEKSMGPNPNDKIIPFKSVA